MTKNLKWVALLALFSLLAACASSPTAANLPTAAPTTPEEHEEADLLALPPLQAAVLDGRPLRVVATTSLVADAVARVGGDAISLTVLMGAGQDPHSYEPTARDFAAVADADVLFTNGWGLEEGLLGGLTNTAADVLIIPISAGIEPLESGQSSHEEEEGDEEHEHGPADPHVWFRVANVIQWTQNAATALSALDPAHAADYAGRAETYTAELTILQEELATALATIPADKRKLVTNHDVFAYFAADYGFEVVGTVIPSSSTLAEPSANDLAELVALMRDEGVCTLFTENTTSGQLAQAIGAELGSCAAVQILPLYTDALGPAGSGAETYLDLMRHNAQTIVAGLAE